MFVGEILEILKINPESDLKNLNPLLILWFYIFRTFADF